MMSMAESLSLLRHLPFAGLVNCTTIDWFTEWPADALYEVAAKQLADEDLGSQDIKSNMCQVNLSSLANFANLLQTT